MQRFRYMWPSLRLRWLSFWGWLANLSGYPCIIREGEYHSPSVGVDVRVKASRLYTVVTVNDVDVYFYRLTGGYDGAGVSQASDCTASGRGGLARSA